MNIEDVQVGKQYKHLTHALPVTVVAKGTRLIICQDETGIESTCVSTHLSEQCHKKPPQDWLDRHGVELTGAYRLLTEGDLFFLNEHQVPQKGTHETDWAEQYWILRKKEHDYDPVEYPIYQRKNGSIYVRTGHLDIFPNVGQDYKDRTLTHFKLPDGRANCVPIYKEGIDGPTVVASHAVFQRLPKNAQ